jgi:TIR domain
VRPFHEALSALGFDVFWDQAVPAGTDWDTWIREKLAASRVVVLFWSSASVKSDNVRHEAIVARDEGKLVPVLLDELRVNQFPMGLFTTQAARLMAWSGSNVDAEWQNLLSQIEAKTIPPWIERKIARYQGELNAERKRREAAQAQEDASEAQLAKEINGQGELRREREKAVNEAVAARAELAGLKKALSVAETQNAELHGRIAQAERVGGTAQSGTPLWTVVAMLIASFVVGGGSVYILHSVPLQTQLVEDEATLAKQEAEREEAKKREAARQEELERKWAAAPQKKIEDEKVQKREEHPWCYQTPPEACWRAQGCALEAGHCVAR